MSTTCVRWCGGGLATYEGWIAMWKSVVKEVSSKISGWTRVNFDHNTDITHDKCASRKHRIPKRVTGHFRLQLQFKNYNGRPLMKNRRLRNSTNQMLHFYSTWPFTGIDPCFLLFFSVTGKKWSVITLNYVIFFTVNTIDYIVGQLSNGWYMFASKLHKHFLEGRDENKDLE